MKKSTESPVVLGRISGLFGVRGWVKIHSYTGPRESILRYRRWQLLLNGQLSDVSVQQGHRQGKGVVAQLEGFDDRTAAELLVGAEIRVDRGDLKPLATGEYYWMDLIGCQVANLADESLGEVVDLMETGANDVLVVQQGGSERLIPFVDPWIVSVDLEGGQIRVDWDADF